MEEKGELGREEGDGSIKRERGGESVGREERDSSMEWEEKNICDYAQVHVYMYKEQLTRE